MSFLKYKNIYFVPSFHNKIQFAFEVRKAFSEIKPDIVAIELPDIYYSDVIKAVEKKRKKKENKTKNKKKKEKRKE